MIFVRDNVSSSELDRCRAIDRERHDRSRKHDEAAVGRIESSSGMRGGPVPPEPSICAV